MTDQPDTLHVVVDTDGGLDDALALTYLTRHPDIELVAVGSVHGNVSAPAAARNSLRVLELAGDTATPVAVGAAAPLNQPLHLRHPDDPVAALAGAPEREPVSEPAPDQLVRLARRHPATLTLLALGPLTNLALALRLEPDLPRLLRRVVIMGGALSVAGNITEHAESNIGHDPDAADTVLAAGFDCTLVPLDLTRQATATRDWLTALAADHTHLWGRCAAALLQDDRPLPPLPLHDPLAAALAHQPHLAAYQHGPVHVELRDTRTRGRTTLGTDQTRRPVAIATTVDLPAFHHGLLDTLTAPTPQA